jgi:hypothetical protein
MFPKWESYRGFDANVYEIKKAGYSWPEVREMGLAKEAFDRSGPLTAANAGSKLRTAYKREAERRGEIVLPGKQQPMNPKLYRDSFAASFASAISSRFKELSAEYAAGDGEYTIAIQTEEDRVLAEFYRLFPNLHPDEIRKRNDAAREAHHARIAGMTPAQRRAWERQMASGQKTRSADMNGWKAGRRAADAVNLSRGNAVGDPDKKEIS